MDAPCSSGEHRGSASRPCRRRAPPRRRGGRTRGESRSHQLQVGRLVARLDLDHPLPLAAAATQLGDQGAQPALRLLRPLLVLRLREQVAGIPRRGGGAGSRIARRQRRLGRALEALGIDLDRACRKELDQARPQHDRLAIAERPPCMVRRLAQVRATRLGSQVPPQCLDAAIPRQAPTLGEREQLDELGRTAPRPPSASDLSPVEHDAEAAEQLDANRGLLRAWRTLHRPASVSLAAPRVGTIAPRAGPRVRRAAWL